MDSPLKVFCSNLRGDIGKRAPVRYTGEGPIPFPFIFISKVSHTPPPKQKKRQLFSIGATGNNIVPSLSNPLRIPVAILCRSLQWPAHRWQRDQCTTGKSHPSTPLADLSPYTELRNYTPNIATFFWPFKGSIQLWIDLLQYTTNWIIINDQNYAMFRSTVAQVWLPFKTGVVPTVISRPFEFGTKGQQGFLWMLALSLPSHFLT